MTLSRSVGWVFTLVLIDDRDFENVLTSEACLFCLLLSRHDSFKECFGWWSWFWEFSDQWGLCSPACNCLLYAHGIENVLVSEACLFCLFLSRHDSFKECFVLRVSDQWGLCLPTCNCLIYAHGIENVLVSEACLFCLLLSRHDSFKECFDWWSWFWEFLTSEACVCRLVIVWFMLMALKTFWSVRHVYFAFLLSRHDSFMRFFRDFESFLTSEACVCLLVIVWFMLMTLKTFWSVRHVYFAFLLSRHDSFMRFFRDFESFQ